MNSINRSAVVIKPKQAFVDWLNSIPDEEIDFTLERISEDNITFLIPLYDDPRDAKNYIKKRFKQIFEFELFGWYTDGELWPKKRTWEMFQEWFSIEINSEVFDLVDGEIEKRRCRMGDDKFPNLNSEQADNLVEFVKEMLGEQASKILEGSGLNINDVVRFMYISRLCQKTREEKGLSLKNISSKLKIPQYKLKYIEESGIGNINADILEKYIKYLGLEKEFNEWLSQNKDVYEQLCKSEK